MFQGGEGFNAIDKLKQGIAVRLGAREVLV